LRLDDVPLLNESSVGNRMLELVNVESLSVSNDGDAASVRSDGVNRRRWCNSASTLAVSVGEAGWSLVGVLSDDVGLDSLLRLLTD